MRRVPCSITGGSMLLQYTDGSNKTPNAYVLRYQTLNFLTNGVLQVLIDVFCD